MKKYIMAAVAATVGCALFLPTVCAQGTVTVPVTMETCPSCSNLNNSVTAYNYALDYLFSHPQTNTNLEIIGGDGTTAMFWVDGNGMPSAESGFQSLPVDGSGGTAGGGDGGGDGGGSPGMGGPCDLAPCGGNGDPIINPD